MRAKAISVFAVAISLFAFLPSAFAQAEANGELHGAPYRIRIPANWNGTLLVHLHGYRDKADHAGEVDDRSVEAAPGGLAGENFFLSQGYAIAGTAYRDNGWAVDEARDDVRALVTFFGDQFGRPERTILLGFSMGSVVAFDSIERFGGLYDGVVAGCAVGAGTSRTFGLTADVMLAYDIAFGMPATLGVPGHVRDDVDFETELAPRLFGQLSNPANFGKFEFIRMVSGFAASPEFYPGGLFTLMYFSSEGLAELQRRAGGAVTDNFNHHYSLTSAEKLYLAGLGVNADSLLGSMNARRNIVADTFARNYLEHNADFSGRIHHPVLTIHTIIDSLVPVSSEHAYAETVARARRSDLLVQTYTTGIGHCNFTAPQLLTAVRAMDSWLRTGTKPTSANFPAALGFAPSFVPPPFRQP
ncbi:MAG TPA: hypothetical protein VJ691_06230 [Vicinamibacterales bacterium]|nr:hypothetical protein [Vicinamibacterales bacterium]